MARRDRLTITAAVVVCLLGSRASTLLASDEFPANEATSVSAQPSTSVDTTSLQTPPPSVAAVDVITIPARPLAAYASGSRMPLRFGAVPDAFAAQVYRGRPIRGYNRDGSIAAMIIGAAAAITGASLLIYANRPECDTRPYAGACGYGTKVIGGAVLSGGLVSLTIGALTW